jgi:hypothetical protein
MYPYGDYQLMLEDMREVGQQVTRSIQRRKVAAANAASTHAGSAARVAATSWPAAGPLAGAAASALQGAGQMPAQAAECEFNADAFLRSCWTSKERYVAWRCSENGKDVDKTPAVSKFAAPEQRRASAQAEAKQAGAEQIAGAEFDGDALLRSCWASRERYVAWRTSLNGLQA